MSTKIFYAAVQQKKPYKSHFRQMEITFSASSGDDAEEMVKSMIEVLHLGEIEIVELYRDDRANLFPVTET